MRGVDDGSRTRVRVSLYAGPFEQGMESQHVTGSAAKSRRGERPPLPIHCVARRGASRSGLQSRHQVGDGWKM